MSASNCGCDPDWVGRLGSKSNMPGSIGWVCELHQNIPSRTALQHALAVGIVNASDEPENQVLLKRLDMPTGQETRITDPVTGGQKNSKQCQLGAVDPLALIEVGKVAGFGGDKYERYNFTKGYRWSLSYDAMQRHLMAFWGGEDLDSESGLHHCAHAAWHCLALMTFSFKGLGTDDRFPTGGA